MATLRLNIVTAERSVFTDDVEMVVAPAQDGVVGILPHHAPLVTVLKPGELKLVRGGEEELLAVHVGFLQARPDQVIILADAAERAEEIDLALSQAARDRARQALEHPSEGDVEVLRGALQRALLRVHVGERIQRHAGRHAHVSDEQRVLGG